jgi:hypothetical protein
MEIEEVFELGRWYSEHVPIVGKEYKNLQTVLQHNASPNAKQPVQGPLEELIAGLNALPMTELSLQQVAHLDKMDVGHLLGVRGAEFVKRVVTQSSYDPATSATEIETAMKKVNNTIETFNALASHLTGAAFEQYDDADELGDGDAMARIQFRQDASIGNLAEMKKWSNDWNDIARGIGHLVGETPHDLKVVGASKGSIIVSVTGSMMLISALAFMSKKVSGIVLDVFRVKNAIEDLRHKRLSNEAIESSMKTDLDQREAALMGDIVTGLKERAGENYSPEHDAHLEIAVKKYINFSKKGGELDFLKPPEPEFDDEDTPDDGSEAAQSLLVNELRGLISEVRSIKNETLLIGDLSGDAGE